jgi:hypothetical protein
LVTESMKCVCFPIKYVGIASQAERDRERCYHISSSNLPSGKRFAITYHTTTFHPINGLPLHFILPPFILQKVLLLYISYKRSANTLHLTIFHPTKRCTTFHPSNGLQLHFILPPFILQKVCYYISSCHLSSS